MVPEMMSLYSIVRMTALAPCPTVNSRGSETLSVSPVASPVDGSITSTSAGTLSKDFFRSPSHDVAALVDAVGMAVLSTAIPR